jgi:hypothetical protein
MPISGKFYTSEELQTLLGVTKQRVSNLARQQNWAEARPGLYYSQPVESYLLGRAIDPVKLAVTSWDYPEGITPAQEQELYNEMLQQQDVDDADEINRREETQESEA